MTAFLGYRGRVRNGRLTRLVASWGSLEDERGIDSRTALAWLSRPVAARWGRYRVAYGFDLECNLLLRDLPADHLARLLDGETVAWAGYSIEWIPGMLLHVKPVGQDGVVIYDLAAWFKLPLGRAVDHHAGQVPGLRRTGHAGDPGSPLDPPPTEHASEHDHIALLEVLADSLLAATGGLASVGPLTRFYGPGALASKALAQSGARLHLKRFTPERTAPALWQAFSRGYVGGRAELLRLGGFDQPIWRYDLNSAYGWGLAQLPPIGFMWAHVGPERLGELDCAVWRVRWQLRDDQRGLPGPLPWRARSGQITYPAAGEGWYWAPEVKAAMELFGARHFQVQEGWAHAAKRRSNVALLADQVYQERQERRGASPMADALLKLLLPAVYGKLAQRKGRAAWSCLPAAGLVTSHVRAALLLAAMQAPDDAIAFATDALYSTVPLSLPIGDGLGQWREDSFAGGTFIQPGVYRLINHDGTQLHRSRGFVATPSEFNEVIDKLSDPGGVVLQRPAFIGHALARLLPNEYRAHLFTVLNLPYTLQPYRSLKRVYDIWSDDSHDYALRPITDWRTENRRSWMMSGGVGMTARHDVTSTARFRGAAESDGARAVLLAQG